jgi:hypothetical protein
MINSHCPVVVFKGLFEIALILIDIPNVVDNIRETD